MSKNVVCTGRMMMPSLMKKDLRIGHSSGEQMIHNLMDREKHFLMSIQRTKSSGKHLVFFHHQMEKLRDTFESVSPIVDVRTEVDTRHGRSTMEINNKQHT